MKAQITIEVDLSKEAWGYMNGGIGAVESNITDAFFSYGLSDFEIIKHQIKEDKDVG